jgi:cytoskeletal protein RodZ
MSEKKDLPELLKDLVTARGLSAEKLALSTNIPRRFINALLEGKYSDLPSKPYIRGYLIKIASILETDPEVLLQSYSNSTELPTSGKKDNLPTNRFALKSFNRNRGLVAVGVIIILLLVVFVLRFNNIIGAPKITVDIPAVTSQNPLHVTGKVNPGDRLTVNGEAAYPADDGSFTKDILLERGLNSIEFDIKHFLGRETKVMKQVIYEPTNQ